MEQLFIIQLITSIFIGGLFVSLLTIIAERLPQRAAGVVLSIPSTIVLGLFFIALTTSPSVVTTIAPSMPISMGATIIFCIIYVYLANNIPLSRITSMVVSTLGAIFIWLLFAIPIVHFKVSHFLFSLPAFVLLAAIGHYLLYTKPKIKTEPIRIIYTLHQKIIRAIAGGLIIGLIVFMAKFLGPFWGGVFSTFPAVYLSTLLIIHYYHDKKFLFHITKTIPVSSFGFIIYLLVVQYTYPRIGIIIGTIYALIISLIYLISLSYILYIKEKFGQNIQIK